MNRSIALSLSVAAIALLELPSHAEAGGGRVSNVTANTIKIDGVRYWRKKASEATLASVGVKMTPAVGSNFFQLKRGAPKGVFKVRTGSPVVVAKAKTSDWGVAGGVSNVQGGVGGNGSSSAQMTLYKMRIDIGNDKGALRRETNRNHKHLEALKHEGAAGRMVSAVWILIEGAESKESCYSGELNVTAGGLNIETSANGCSNSSYQVSAGSIVAYELVKPDRWDNAVLSEPPSCPSGFPKYETRSAVANPKDRCAKTKLSDSGVRCNLAATDKRKNWYVSARAGRDTCKSKRGKSDKGVECVHGSHKYISQSGKDKCQEPTVTYKDPTCPPGYDYDKRSGSKGVDRCNLRGVDDFTFDSNSGF